jgi:hypothetical protein
MDAVFGDPGLGDALEEQARLTGRTLDSHGRIVLRIVNSEAAQPYKLASS